MAAAPVSVASVVVLPGENQEQIPPESPSLKRRRSSVPSIDEKRQRLSDDNTQERAAETPNSRSTAGSHNLINDRRRHGQMEERKRGQRLFGALLGTLSQSSSSTAQKRRADIENKQRDKLRMQAQEEDERRQVHLSELNEKRVKEQIIFDRQSNKIEGGNLVAQAHFLKTKAQPSLFYRPWELLPEDEERIKKQIAEAEAEVPDKSPSAQEVLGYYQNPASPDQNMGQETEMTDKPRGEGLPNGRDSEETPLNDTNKSELGNPNRDWISSEQEEKAKENVDDVGEEVQGDEDTVIY